MKINKRAGIFYFILLFGGALQVCSFAWSAPVVEKYTYDELGRLVKVSEANGTTQVGYCYDAAGNRRAVLAGSAGNQDCENLEVPQNTLDMPSGLVIGSHQGGLVARWNSVTGATFYKISYRGVVYSVTST